MKKKEGKNEEKILGFHLTATVSKGEKLVSNNGRLAMVSHHCLHLYISSIGIHILPLMLVELIIGKKHR